MKAKDKYYIEIAELVHQAVIKWDPYALIEAGAPDDEYDLIEKRFISGLINSATNDEIIGKVIRNLNNYGSDYADLDEAKQANLKSEINLIIEDLKKQTANRVGKSRY